MRVCLIKGQLDTHRVSRKWAVSTNQDGQRNGVRMRSIRKRDDPTRNPNKNKSPLARALEFLVPEIGIEPTTYALRMRRSTN